jgi:hypothetical protein
MMEQMPSSSEHKNDASGAAHNAGKFQAIVTMLSMRRPAAKLEDVDTLTLPSSTIHTPNESRVARIKSVVQTGVQSSTMFAGGSTATLVFSVLFAVSATVFDDTNGSPCGTATVGSALGLLILFGNATWEAIAFVAAYKSASGHPTCGAWAANHASRSRVFSIAAIVRMLCLMFGILGGLCVSRGCVPRVVIGFEVLAMMTTMAHAVQRLVQYHTKTSSSSSDGGRDEGDRVDAPPESPPASSEIPTPGAESDVAEGPRPPPGESPVDSEPAAAVEQV